MFSHIEMYVQGNISLPKTPFFHVQSGFVLRHKNNVQNHTCEKSIRVSPCFNVVILRRVLYCTGFKINALVFLEECVQHMKKIQLGI